MLWVNLFTMQIKQKQTDWRACGYTALSTFSGFSLLWRRLHRALSKSFNPQIDAPEPLSQIRPLVPSQVIWASSTHRLSLLLHRKNPRGGSAPMTDFFQTGWKPLKMSEAMAPDSDAVIHRESPACSVRRKNPSNSKLSLPKKFGFSKSLKLS